MTTFPIIKAPAWTVDAACASPDVSPAIFFPDPGHQPVEARAICVDCTVQLQCLALALSVENGVSATSRHGVYAGLTPQQRADLSSTRPKESLI